MHIEIIYRFLSWPCFSCMMKAAVILSVAASLLMSASGQTVSGAAEGFAKGATGAGNATPYYPTSLTDLDNVLGDSVTRVIVLNHTCCYQWGNLHPLTGP
jgi:hypothetical protein